MPLQIRDPVHDFITLNDHEQNLVSTPALQRLRGIRQLALASLVYPGALHTRFDHTLGVMHVAGLMAKALKLGGDDTHNIRIAALLHDIGHGPFSHVSEYALDRYADRTTLKPDQKKEKIHELVTGLMIQNDSNIIRELGQRTCDTVAQLLATGHGERVVRQIISGPLDADKQDYLLRDSYFCGVQYGIFDHHQLHRSLISVPESHGHELMIRVDGVHAVEQYVLAKYYLTSNVYRHKVRLITDQMIVRAITLGIEHDEIAELHQLYSFDNTPEFVDRYSRWDDSRFMQTFGVAAIGGKCHEMLQRLIQRMLLKRIFSGTPADFSVEVKEQLLTLVKTDRDRNVQGRRDAARGKVERAVAELLRAKIGHPVDPSFVIYHAFDIKSAKEMSRNDEASIQVNKRPNPIPFEQASNLFESIDVGSNEEFVEIYAPMTWPNHTDRDRRCGEMRAEIIAIIEQELKPSEQGANP